MQYLILINSLQERQKSEETTMNTEFYDFSRPTARLQHEMLKTAEKTFRIMQENNLIAVPERKAFAFAVWPRQLYPFPFPKAVIGTTFDPKLGFDKNCNTLVEEKQTRQFEYHDSCSAATRNPEEGKWEGSISVIIDGFEWGFSASGLKGREDQAVSIMNPCIILPDHFSLKTPRIKRILEICEGFEDLKGITGYTHEVFNTIKQSLNF